jgi:hypothetical protein
MALVQQIEYESASAEVRAVYDDIRATRKTDFINNFWKVLANDPAALARTWANVKQVMAPVHSTADQGNGLRRRQHHQQLRVLHPLARGWRDARKG